jgi:hypothetical protein
MMEVGRALLARGHTAQALDYLKKATEVGRPGRGQPVGMPGVVEKMLLLVPPGRLGLASMVLSPCPA